VISPPSERMKFFRSGSANVVARAITSRLS
jgi:hypothetical protein